MYGPQTRMAQELHQQKYCNEGESFYESQVRVANRLKDSDEHYQQIKDIFLNQRFMPAGRIQSAIGSPRKVTPFNCFVSQTITDSFDSIMEGATKAGQTMRLGGGIGFDFSRLRPKGDRIVTLDSFSSGPLSFMEIYDAICQTISSAGHRRGAMMGVLRVDHPDIEAFIKAKQETGKLEGFNLSIGITDEFMQAVEDGDLFTLQFQGRPYKQVDARNLWDTIMRSTWDWAEPGVLFIDTINRMNNLWYCEQLETTNPCGEQPLPANGACLLGSFNLTKYLYYSDGVREFDWGQFVQDIPPVVRAMDKIHDLAIFPLPEQAQESHNKRRMGLGVTGMANALEAMGHLYGSSEYLHIAEDIHRLLCIEAYKASIELAKEKGCFPAYTDQYLASPFIKRLPEDVVDGIRQHGIRNSHLISYAPTGTISVCADNVSGSIEPVFAHSYDRRIVAPNGSFVTEVVQDYNVWRYGVFGKKAAEVSPIQHLTAQAKAQKWCDSAVSKTINIDSNCDWEEFKNIYMLAWRMGLKGCTTFNADGNRYGILIDKETEGAKACYINPETGAKECS